MKKITYFSSVGDRASLSHVSRLDSTSVELSTLYFVIADTLLHLLSSESH